MNMQTQRVRTPSLRSTAARPGDGISNALLNTRFKDSMLEHPSNAPTCNGSQLTTQHVTQQIPPPGGASEGGSHKSHQGTQQDAQVTAKFDEATARQTHATPTDIYDELATTSKHKPLHKSGFVSPPTTATTDARRASGTVALVMLSPSAPAAMQEQRTQVATGGSAGNTSNHRRFFGHRSRPPHQRGPGHGTHQR